MNAPYFVAEVSSNHNQNIKRCLSFIPEIAARCREKKIKFVCTPFYLKAVDELFPYVDFYKIASYELL